MTAKTPEGADLAYLADRARAYVVGLEARLWGVLAALTGWRMLVAYHGETQ